MRKVLVRAAAVTAALLASGALATASLSSDAAAPLSGLSRGSSAPMGGQVAIVQADLGAGSHEVTFTDGSDEIASTVEVTAGQSSDVVVHRPAEVGGEPVVSVYPTPTDPIGPGKARVLLAHTATTAPADVVVDGQTVFTNIANGEFAQADVAAGAHEVSLLPAGVKGSPILGPLDVTLEEGTMTSVYAVGNPKDGSMNVIVRTTGGPPSDGQAPTEIDTGSAGLVGNIRVWTFSTGR
jgi:hypothetical protein